MQATEDLFKLIKSLSKSEKRMFKLSASRSTGRSSNNYIRLFEAIGEMETYDEVQLKEQFKGEPLVNNFSVAKSYLYDSILNSLRNTRGTGSKEMELRRLLDQVEVLHKRGLYGQANKVLRKGLRIAQDQALLHYETELRRWQRRLVNLQSGKNRYERLVEVEEAEGTALAALQTEARLRSIRAQVQAIFLDQVDLRKPEIAQLLEKLVSDPVMLNPPDTNDPHAFYTCLAYFHIKAIHARLKSDPFASMENFHTVLQVWEARPRIIQSQPSQYIIALTNFLDSCMRAHQFEDFVPTVSKLHALPVKDPRLQARAFYLGTHLEIRFAITTGQLALAIDKVVEIEAGLKQHARYLSPTIELTFLYNLTVIHFLARDFPTAISFSNRILNRPSTPVRQDLVDGARLFELVSHFEMEHYDLLESLLRSMQRRLRSKPRSHAFENVLVRGLRKLMAAPPSKLRTVYEALRDEFEAVEGAAYLVAREELQLWIKSKIEERGIEELLVELAATKPVET